LARADTSLTDLDRREFINAAGSTAASNLVAGTNKGSTT